MDAMVGSTK